jgi:hypothetical protein
MKRSRNFVNETQKQKRKPGRPRISEDLATAVAVRLPRSVLAAVTQWAVDNDASRSEAIRRLVERGLAAESAEPSKPRRPARPK